MKQMKVTFEYDGRKRILLITPNDDAQCWEVVDTGVWSPATDDSKSFESDQALGRFVAGCVEDAIQETKGE